MSDKTIQKLTVLFNVAVVISLSTILNFAICGLNFYVEISIIGQLLSMLVMGLIFTILTMIFKKSYRAVYIISTVIFMLGLINNVKFHYTFNPIYLPDVYFLSNIGEISGLVKPDIVFHLNYLRFFILAVVIFVVSFITRLYYIEVKSHKVRIICGIICALILTIIFIPQNSKDRFLLNNIYNPQNRKDYAAMINNLEYYQKYSVIAGMFGLQLEDRAIEPETYNETEIEQLINTATSTEAITLDVKKPNIIIMFQESYWDVEKLSEIEFEENVTENVSKLREFGNTANMLSSTYGGLSCNVEFELLTGGNLAFFSKGYNPFMQMYRNKRAEDSPSILKELKQNNYYTKVVFGRDYFDSGSIYQRLGVDQYVNEYRDRKDYEDHVKGNFISDHALVDDAINELKNKPKDKNLFYMTCTIQSHMPFYKEKYKDYDIHIKETSLSENEQGIILSYSQCVYDTNVELMRLYNEIQKIDEPTVVIVLLGDHLPYLYNEKGEDILLKSSYFNTGDEVEDLLRKYSTEVLALSNYEYTPEFKYNYVSPDYILTKIINDLGMNVSPFYKITNDTHDTISALNQYLLIDNNSYIYHTNNITSAEARKDYNLRENLQYYYFRK